MAGDLELKRTDGGQHGRLVAAPIRAQNLHHAFLLQLLDALAELLVLTRIGAAGDGEVLGEKLGIGGNCTGTSRYSVSPGRRTFALARPITSPGHASSSVERCCPNTDCAYLVTNGLPVAAWVSTSPRSNVPEQTRA